MRMVVAVGGGWLLALGAALLPTAIYAGLIWWVDRYEKEPVQLLLVAFIWGALPAAVIVVLLESFTRVWLLAASGPLVALGATLAAPIIEETVKGAAVIAVARRRAGEFNGVLDGIVYGAFVGLGFALTENLLVIGTADESVRQAAMVTTLRTVVFGLNHPVFGAVFGAALGWTRYHGTVRTRQFVPLVGLAGAVALHWLHNELTAGAQPALPVAVAADWAGMGLVASVIWLAWASERRWLAAGLRLAMEAGNVSPAERALAASPRRRAASEWRAWREGGWPAYRARVSRFEHLTNLAYASYHAARAGATASDSVHLEQARQRVAAGTAVVAGRAAGRRAPN